jgi:hypothetical protein
VFEGGILWKKRNKCIVKSKNGAPPRFGEKREIKEKLCSPDEMQAYESVCCVTESPFVRLPKKAARNMV